MSGQLTAIVLAAGYATRLGSLTDTTPKALLPVGGRPVIEHTMDALEALPSVGSIHIVTNARHYARMREWADSRTDPAAAAPRIVLHNDGTTSNEERLGGTGDLGFVLQSAGIGGAFLLLPSDRIMEMDYADFIRAFHRLGGAVNTVHDAGSLDAVRGKHGCVLVDAGLRIVDFEEKPQDPKSTLTSVSCYIYPEGTAPLVEEYLAGGGNRDAPGHFARWYIGRRPLYAYMIHGRCWDIGTIESYRETDKALSKRARGG